MTTRKQWGMQRIVPMILTVCLSVDFIACALAACVLRARGTWGAEYVGGAGLLCLIGLIVVWVLILRERRRLAQPTEEVATVSAPKTGIVPAKSVRPSGAGGGRMEGVPVLPDSDDQAERQPCEACTSSVHEGSSDEPDRRK